ncbi:hypothetical protein ACS0TY_001666 [Phlomoides rotata]
MPPPPNYYPCLFSLPFSLFPTSSRGGALQNVSVGGGYRRNKQSKSNNLKASPASSDPQIMSKLCEKLYIYFSLMKAIVKRYLLTF